MVLLIFMFKPVETTRMLLKKRVVLSLIHTEFFSVQDKFLHCLRTGSDIKYNSNYSFSLHKKGNL